MDCAKWVLDEDGQFVTVEDEICNSIQDTNVITTYYSDAVIDVLNSSLSKDTVNPARNIFLTLLATAIATGSANTTISRVGCALNCVDGIYEVYEAYAILSSAV